MALTANEHLRSSVPVQDNDGRLIVVGPDGVAIGGGGGGSDPLSDGNDAGALPTKTLWIAGADGTVLRGVRVDSSGRIRTVVENLLAVSGPLTNTELRLDAVDTEGNVAHDAVDTGNPIKVGGKALPGTPAAVASGDRVDAHFDTLGRQGIWIANKGSSLTAEILNAAPGSDTGQSALAVRVVSQLGAGAGGGGSGQADKSTFTEGTTSFQPVGGVLNETITADPAEDQAAAARITPKRAVHTNLRNNAGTEIATSTNPVRTDPTGTTAQPVSDGGGSLTVDGTVGVNNFPATQPVSGPLTDAQLRASAVPVSGTFFQATQPVSLASVPIVTEKQDQPAGTTATWTSATALNTALTNSSVSGYGTATVSIQVPSTVTGGVITLEVSDDGTVWYQAGSVRVDNGQQENVITLALSPGQALNRMYSVSVDAMTHIRARLSTVIAGAGNVVVRITLIAGGIEPFVAYRSRKVATYRVVYRVAARPYRLSNVFAAAGRKQYATIHHAATATRTVRLRHVWVTIQGATAATTVDWELIRITTAPVTGNPVITPAIVDNLDPAAEATCLALPTTAATESGGPLGFQQYLLGISGTSPTTMPPPAQPWIDLLALSSNFDDETKAPTIRAGVLEGFAITVDVDVAATVNGNVMIEFTEEPA